MVDVIVSHWVGILTENEAGPGDFGCIVSEKVTLFYSYDGLIASTNPVWLKWGFDVLIVLFEWVGLITNVDKMVMMVCQPGTISRRQSVTAYRWHITGEGDPPRVKQHWRLVCGEFGFKFAMAYMDANLHMHHGR